MFGGRAEDDDVSNADDLLEVGEVGSQQLLEAGAESPADGPSLLWSPVQHVVQQASAKGEDPRPFLQHQRTPVFELGSIC